MFFVRYTLSFSVVKIYRTQMDILRQTYCVNNVWQTSVFMCQIDQSMPNTKPARQYSKRKYKII